MSTTGLIYVLWGAATAALFAYGGGSILYREYKLGVPSLLAGLALYGLLWFTMS